MTSRRRSPTLTPEEAALWRDVAAKTRPLRGKSGAAADTPPKARRDSRKSGEKATYSPGTSEQGPSGPGSKSMDARLAERLRRGRLPIEGTIDLHGLTLREAETRLYRYLEEAAQRDKRCILVITGKGAPPPRPHERDYMPERPRPGAIRAALPRWLNDGPVAGRVLAHHPAQPKHGGPGAFYVLLRRRREW